MKAKSVTFNALKKLSKTTEGLVILGCGGDLQEWINGITEILHEEKAVKTSDADKVWGKALTVKTKTTKGRIDLILTFPEKPTNIKESRLPIVRIAMYEQFPNSWLSDYVVNYAKDHK